MIRPEAMAGAAFGTAGDGDGRDDPAVRAVMSQELSISPNWATIDQVHGSVAVEAVNPGPQGEADALFTSVVGLPLVVATADCVPVVLEGPKGVAVVHAGWRGMVAGVIAAVRSAATESGITFERAAIGPAIGPCCYRVGDEVVEMLAPFEAETADGAPSVDLWAAARYQLQGLEIWQSESCTMSDGRYHSYRRDATSKRQVALAWLPNA